MKIDDYLEKTAILRDEETNILIATTKPHKKVAISTVSRWLKDVLQLSGINSDILKAHSTRSASISKAFLKSASIEEIMKTAYWSNESTFQKFYNRKVVEANSFQSTVSESFMIFSHNKNARAHTKLSKDFINEVEDCARAPSARNAIPIL